MAAPTKPTIPWKLRVMTSLLSLLLKASRRSNGTVNRRLFNLFDPQLPPNPNSIDGVTTSDVTVDATRNLWFRLFSPTTSASAATLPVVVFFHGGGFAFLSPASTRYDAFCRSLCRSINAVIISVNYRLAPEHRYPSQNDDGFDVVKYLDENGATLGNVGKCFLAGDSSGGNTAHHVAIRVCKERLRFVRVIGLVSIEPFFGGQERVESEIRITQDPLVSLDATDWYWKAFLPNGSDRDHEVVNVSGPNAVDISGLNYPKTLLVVAGFDPLKDWQRRYSEWLRKSGKDVEIIEYPKMIHGFHLFPFLPDVSEFLSHVNHFIVKQVAGS
ncbi:hypothetical protein LR48_Vigan10g058400 [Vigna angularis]|uniref:Carboxylesterase 18 n=2 Tax=Phaseolus angularis TaxID=3914 RepID=A0A0L9VIF7_PHAAN|nr:probable carboxylesterase 18 [Vigna angularis]KAG2384954.1 carboxylesterase 18 [Vigna angularis]KOM54692.1 hypothetical protein LR48_Vigan10g058400 [Vigna angularis]BAU02501.1 hypothetical protein VIGAN_11204400 [Vigna angularis var. angularis]